MENFSEWYHEILENAEIIDSRYPVKGMHAWLPYGFKIRKKIIETLRKLLDEDHDEVLFPLLIPEEELMKESIHIKGFEDEVYWVTHGGKAKLKRKLALRPTSETAMYPMFSLWIRTHKDLPLKVYQIVNTFRYETKHTRPLIRIREITTFKEAHTVHKTLEGAEKQVKKAINIYKTFFDSLGIPYLITKRPEWDKFPGAVYTIAFDTLMPDGRTLQIGTIHNLGQNFSKTFDITFETEEGKHEHAYQTCYGVSDRVIASVISIHGDEKGLCLPPKIAPIQIVIVPIIFKETEEEVLEFCKNVEKKLKEGKLKVHLDDRDIRAGRKFYEWEMKGIPLRIEIGPKDIEKNKVVVVRRDSGEKMDVKFDDNFVENIKSIIEKMNNDMRKRAWEKMKKKIYDVDDIKKCKDIINNGKGVVRVIWCGNENCGKNLEEKIKADMLGIEGKSSGKCLNCNEDGKYKVLLAKTY
ncbi:prolyl-tRNA synthetase [Methanothermus fervidus DSM 2088]|uniref:Proline--tRNA ligase n=1 Tax=Methanothermus fervidus (strain ATCC 43054 / DSM 2088 / JCM 10308 / V24 S) TaxID=523846 RepID=E3GW71_METFV|nr:proline--tRNA ligase [Methanothermus fervidus]ADP77836.1 prolyl-tRNA synthetase [Methanothermus fervidus DSM 2088]